MAMNCGEFKELAWAWALGTLDEAEDAACAAHLASPDPHQGCEDCYRDGRALTERLATAVGEHPVAPRVWTVIEDRVRAEERPAVVQPAAATPSQPPTSARARHLASV
jgi:hypothetical protein